MRSAIAVVAVALAAAPAFAAHGHASSPKPASEQPVRASGPKEGSPKNSHDKLGYEKSPYEKRLHASEREYEQARSNKVKGLPRSTDESTGSSDEGESGDAAGSKVKGGGHETAH